MPSPRVSLASVADALDRAVPELDELIREARLGTRHQSEIHELEERAQRLAAAIVGAFRAPQKAAGRIIVTDKGVWAT